MSDPSYTRFWRNIVEMGNKTSRREVEEVLQVRVFQWEFLRRNSEYGRDYENLITRFASWFKANGFWYERNKPYSVRDFVYYNNEICPVLKEICRKWQIADPFPPDWMFDSRGLHEYAPGWWAYVPTGETAESAAHLWDYPTMQLLPEPDSAGHQVRRLDRKSSSVKRERPTDSPRYFQLRLDASRPMHELLAETEKSIEIHRKKHSEFFKSLPEQKGRRRLDQYPAYVKVWDLRAEGKSFSEIAKELYPREYSAYFKQSLGGC